MADTFQLEIVTPEKLVVNEPVEELQMPGADGYLGILPGHAPLITELAVGELSYRTGAVIHRTVVCWGFAEVLPENTAMRKVFSKFGFQPAPSREPQVIHLVMQLI